MHDTAAFDLPLLAVLLSAAVLLVLAYQTSIPYPILRVYRRGDDRVRPGLYASSSPEAVLVIFLPPLLYSAAFFSSLRDLRDNKRPIGLLAVGLVVIDDARRSGVVAQAVVDDHVVAAFAPADRAPTDSVAATAAVDVGRVAAD